MKRRHMTRVRPGTYDDTEFRAFADRAPRHLADTELAESVLAEFGPTRAWSRSKIIRYWQHSHPVRKGKPFRLDADPDQCAFIEDRLAA